MVKPALIAALLLPVPALAGSEADMAKLEACLGPLDARVEQEGRGCIGTISAPCEETLADPTTFARAHCVLREHNVWEALRDRYYEDLHGAASDVARITLREAQSHWTEYRHWDCAAMDELTADQSGDDMNSHLNRHLAVSVCLRDYMAERALWLRHLLARTR